MLAYVIIAVLVSLVVLNEIFMMANSRPFTAGLLLTAYLAGVLALGAFVYRLTEG